MPFSPPRDESMTTGAAGLRVRHGRSWKLNRHTHNVRAPVVLNRRGPSSPGVGWGGESVRLLGNQYDNWPDSPAAETERERETHSLGYHTHKFCVTPKQIKPLAY